MGLSIGKLLDPAGIFTSDKKEKNVNNNTTNITNNYYGNQGQEGPHQCKHKPPGQGGPQDMMQMFAMLMEMMQQTPQGQDQNTKNGSFAFAGAGTFNAVS